MLLSWAINLALVKHHLHHYYSQCSKFWISFDYLLNIDLDVLLLVLKISKPNLNSISLNKEKALITFNKKSFSGLQTFTVTQRLSLPQHFTDLFYNLKKIYINFRFFKFLYFSFCPYSLFVLKDFHMTDRHWDPGISCDIQTTLKVFKTLKTAGSTTKMENPGLAESWYKIVWKIWLLPAF